MKVPQLPDNTVIRKDKGASWFTNQVAQSTTNAHKECNVSPGTNLSEIVHSLEPGSIIILSKGTYPIQRSILIDKPLTIRAADPGNKPLISF